MDIALFDYVPCYVPTDIRKLILSFYSQLFAYLGCAIVDRNYIRVLGVCRTLVQAAKLCLINQSNPSRYHILKVHENDILPDKIHSRLLYPPLIQNLTQTHYPPPSPHFNTTCSFCMEKFERGSPVTCLPCNHLFHFEEICSWLQHSLLCPLCRKIVRDDSPSPFEAGDTVFIDEEDPYVVGVGGPRRMTLSLSKTSQKHLNFYTMTERKWKLKLHPQGGGVPQPYKFFVQ